jgi:hypothetical protein
MPDRRAGAGGGRRHLRSDRSSSSLSANGSEWIEVIISAAGGSERGPINEFTDWATLAIARDADPGAYLHRPKNLTAGRMRKILAAMAALLLASFSAQAQDTSNTHVHHLTESKTIAPPGQ